MSATMWEFMRTWKVEAVSVVPHGLRCSLCQAILVEPKQTPCGCRFCARCIQDVFAKGGTICPGRTEDCSKDQILDLEKDIIVDNHANREVGRLVVTCPYSGCPQKEELRRMWQHVADCEYKEEVCERCHQSVRSREKDIHQLKECTLRKVCCDFCGLELSFQELHQVHHNVQHGGLCERYRSSCPYLCGIRQMVVIKPHLSVCINRPQPCPFAAIGCTLSRVSPQQMTDHLQTEGLAHAKSLVSYIDNLNNEIKTLKLANEAQARRVEELQGLVTLRERVFEPRHKDFIWKVDTFSKWLDLAKKGKHSFVESKPFLSDRYGYKMGLRLYPFGDREARGRHLSLYFVFLVGTYDDILPWPFKGTITLTLLNLNGQEDSVKAETFQALSKDSHEGAGCVNFFEISRLEDRGFLKNDSLFIKCSID